MKVNSGNDMQARVMGGGAVGTSGTSTATGATSMTDSGAAWGTTQYVGGMVFCGNRYANIISHTGTVLTLDRWYDPASPGGAAGSTPGGTTVYVIAPGGLPAWYMGLTANSSSPAAGDTTLTGEITTGGGGLVRKICPYAHTTGAASYTLTPVFTANGSDSLPVTIAKIGVFCSIVVSGAVMVFETLLNATATLSASGDQLTITETVTT